MRIALVGPTHPFKGGVAAHTTETARQLAAAGHDVRLVSWSRLYPEALYPGEQAVPDGGPDLPPYEPVERTLRWDRPRTWWRTGAGLREVDLVVLVTVVPVQVPALLTIAAAARRVPRTARTTPGRRAPRVVAIVHNVVPHETHPGGRALMDRMLRSMDGVLVHSAEQADLARGHGARLVRTASLPPHLPGGLPAPAGRAAAAARPVHRDGAPLRLLALGMVREYKGFDLLVEAVRQVPGVQLTVAGEFWGASGDRVRELAEHAGGRVVLRPGYVPGTEIPALLAAHDVLALPYRHATASQNALLGHAHGLPVLATRVGTFGADVHDGVDGILVAPGDVGALVAGLGRLTAPGQLQQLRAGVPETDVEAPWREYVAALTGLASPATTRQEHA